MIVCFQVFSNRRSLNFRVFVKSTIHMCIYNRQQQTPVNVCFKLKLNGILKAFYCFTLTNIQLGETNQNII